MIGKLRERITFKRKVDVEDGGGGYSTTFANIENIPTVFARVQAIKGKEDIQADQIKAELSYKITIRYRNDIDETMTILWDSKELNIDSITNPDEKKRYLEITAKKGIAI